MFDLTLIHPKIVHFVIALFALSVVLDLFALIFKKEQWASAARINLIFAGVSAILAVGSGLLAEANVQHNEAAHAIMERHETIGFVVLSIIILLVIWRLWQKDLFSGKLFRLYVLAALIGLSLLFTGAYLGGELVYTHGVAVKAVPQPKSHEHDHGESHGHNHEHSENSDTHEGPGN